MQVAVVVADITTLPPLNHLAVLVAEVMVVLVQTNHLLRAQQIVAVAVAVAATEITLVLGNSRQVAQVGLVL
jgi:hypothetical protein